MKNPIQELIENLRRGKYRDMEEQIALLVAALREKGADEKLLLELLTAPQIPLRLAGVEASQGRHEPKILEALRSLVKDRDLKVRVKLAECAGEGGGKLDDVSKLLLKDREENVRVAGLKATARRNEFLPTHRRMVLEDHSWSVRSEAALALKGDYHPDTFKALISALASDTDNDVHESCADALELHLENTSQVEGNIVELTVLGKAESALKGLGEGRFKKLLKWIQKWTLSEVSSADLLRFGTDMTELAAKGKLPRAIGVEDRCQTLIELLVKKRRSAVLLGESGCGKTATVQELVHKLRSMEGGAWTVLRVAPTDFLVGTKWMGEWETKVQDLLKTIRRPRRVLLYIPNVDQLIFVGRHSNSDTNVAGALAPHIADGSIVVLGESTPTAYANGMGGDRPIRSLFESLLIPPASKEETLSLLRLVAGEEAIELSEPMACAIQDAADSFLANQVRPGNAIGLLREVLGDHEDESGPDDLSKVYRALKKSTGIPVDLLDDKIPLDLAKVEGFFESRVMGQPEPVQTVVDVISIIKAGVSDPNKPFSVLLFVGPTGVGKTELARAMAEFIFGDPARLQRFDMSEYATFDGFERLIGTTNKDGVLTEAVRQHPFSVVLFDEIEKAHFNAFNLCLQIFDAGRLTDGKGRTVDFRKTVVILTSNIGAPSSVSKQMGFGSGSASAAQTFDPAKTDRDLASFFRPEFLNRIDRVLHFSPLSLAVAQDIAKKELSRVLARTGIARRRLAVDVDASVLSLLIKDGYSPTYGARPLKRAVEKHVLMPLSRAIASGKVPFDATVCLMEKSGKVLVSVSSRPVAGTKSAPPIRTSQASLAARFDALREAYESLKSDVTRLEQRKGDLLSLTQKPGFYSDQRHAARIFDEIHKLDHFLALHRGFNQALAGLEGRLERRVEKSDESALARRLEELEAELRETRLIAQSKEKQDLDDAFLSLEVIDKQGGDLKAFKLLGEMYLQFAQRRKMNVEVVCEHVCDGKERLVLHFAGLGAYRLLKSEDGLHQIVRTRSERDGRSGRESKRQDRATIKVCIFPDEGAEIPSGQVERKVQKAAGCSPLFLKSADFEVVVSDPKTGLDARGWVTAPKDVAIERIEGFLSALAQANAADRQAPAVIRQYEIGSGGRVKDRRGRSTTQVHRVLKGELELVLA